MVTNDRLIGIPPEFLAEWQLGLKPKKLLRMGTYFCQIITGKDLEKWPSGMKDSLVLYKNTRLYYLNFFTQESKLVTQIASGLNKV